MGDQRAMLIAFADPTRQAVLNLLRRRALTVGELAERLPVSRPAVSQHLQVLKSARLVEEDRRGTQHFFRLNAASLAELRSRWSNHESDALALQARLLGISGLLPAELSRSQSDGDGYLRRVWDRWWRERDEFADCILPRELWRFHGLRPANHPQRRLALASRWSIEGELAAKLEKWCARDIAQNALAGSLLETLQVESDEFWSWHCTFRSARFKKAQPLLGGTRVTDLAVNVVLPWLWIRAVEGKNESMQKIIENRYFAWPRAEDNSVLRLARQRLLGGASPRLLAGAAAQQGLIQIVRDFCEHSNAICEDCKFPELVREWKESSELQDVRQEHEIK